MTIQNPQTAREWLAYGVQRVLAGHPIKRWSPDTIGVGGRCAQLTRETVEGCLGLPANSWPVAVKAHEFRKKRNWPDRWASDYEKAARELGLTKKLDQVKVGDILFWPYRAKNGHDYGHVAVYAGLIDGVPHVLENSDWAPAKRKAQGALLPLGPKAHVYITPLSLLGAPTTVAAPTLELLAEDADALAIKVTGEGADQVPWVQVTDRNNREIKTPYLEATYHGVNFKRVPGGVILWPEGSE